MTIIKIISIITFITSSLIADIKVVNNSISKSSLIKTLKGEKKIYVSTRDIVSSLSARLYENSERKKLVLYISGKKIKISAGTSFLIVDDVYDTGMSVNKVVSDLESACKKNTPEIRIATPYFKPSKNKTDRIPDYYIHETDQWLVFPHELQGLSMDEIRANKPELDSLIKNIESLKSK